MAPTSGWAADSTTGVVGNDQGSNNSSGFSAFPSGYRSSGIFYGIGYYGHWWGSTEGSTTEAYARYMSYNGFVLNNGGRSKQNGSSVRCIKD